MQQSSHLKRITYLLRHLQVDGGCKSPWVEAGRSYQDDGTDGAGGQDVILQGSTVTLGLHMGGTFVMELEEVTLMLTA